LCGGRRGLACGSGRAAIADVMCLLAAGDHFVACDDLYGGTYRPFEKLYTRYGVSFSYLDAADGAALAAAFRAETRLVWLETPTNPLLKVIDVEAAADEAHQAGALLVVDNTFLSPYFQKPLALGADIEVHSTTKYIGGHSDVVGGALVVNDEELYERLKFFQNAVGGVPGPFDCWLVLRGVKTLALRMARHEENASRVATFFEGHRRVARTIYPGLASHPQHAVAARQQAGFGGIVSFILDGGLDEAQAFLGRLKVFTVAESLGGVESLIEHPAIMTHASLPPERRAALGITDSLIRASVGIEDSDDLVADLERALGG